MNRHTVRLASRLHTLAYRATAGLLGHHVAGIDCLLLTTVGARTGRRRTVPLLYLRDGSDYIVVASYGGRPHHPDWYRNLLAEPSATIQVGSYRALVDAATIPPERRTALWARAVEAWADYETYQARTDREIPLVILQPIQSVHSD